MTKPEGKRTFNIQQVVAMRDAHKYLSDGERGFLFSWGFRRKIAFNFKELEKSIASFEDSRDALIKKHGGTPEEKKIPEDHPNCAAWLQDMIPLFREEISLELKPLGIDEFNGDENKTLPADILIKLDAIIEG